MTTKMQTSDKKSGTKYLWLTKYEMETASDRESDNGADSMKNFPTAFVPMKELEEPLLGE